MHLAPDQYLLKKWMPVVDQAAHIFTWTEPLTLCYLAEQVSTAEYALETGVYMGASSYVMLAANPKLHLWAIDPFMVAGTEKTSRHFLREFIQQGRCEIIPKFTREAAKQLEHMTGKIDVAFIDDGHALADVLTDIECIKPLIRPGGLLCGHDYETSPVNEVTMAVVRSLPDHYQPVPRLWAWTKPK